MSNHNQTYTTRSTHWYSARAETAQVDDDSGERALFGSRRDGIFRKLEERAESRTAVLDFDDIESDIERFFLTSGQPQRYGHRADFNAF
jgi:hypothetical protein